MSRSSVGAQRERATPQQRHEAEKRALEWSAHSGMEPLTSLLMVISAASFALIFALVTAVYSIQV